jgi:phosphonopyruvate decarboxylase
VRRDTALGVVLAHAREHGAAVFVGNGLNARAACAIDDRPLTFYMLGSMGLAPAMAVGYVRQSGRPALAVEGDGNALMSLSGLPLAAGLRTAFVHVVLDNGSYESTGGQPTLSAAVDLCTIACGAGYPAVHCVQDGASLAAGLRAALAGGRPAYVHARTELAAGRSPGRVPYHPRDIARRFRAAVSDPTTPVPGRAVA